MKEMLRLGKRISMLLWLGTPLALAKFGRYIMRDPIVIPRLLLAFVIALFLLFRSHARICLYLMGPRQRGRALGIAFPAESV